MAQPLIELTDLHFAWPKQAELLWIPHFELSAGEHLFLNGPSGSGKTTLLSLLGGVLQPTRGCVRLFGQSIAALPAGRRDRFRADHIGYVFQQFNLLPFLTVEQNVALPAHFSRRRAERAASRFGSVLHAAQGLLAQLGLPSSVFTRRADALSIGQQQRVAVARALIGQPELIIADEPTSALDAKARVRFLELLFAECHAAHSSLLFVSHDQALAPLFERQLALSELNQARVSVEDC